MLQAEAAGTQLRSELPQAVVAPAVEPSGEPHVNGALVATASQAALEGVSTAGSMPHCGLQIATPTHQRCVWG